MRSLAAQSCTRASGPLTMPTPGRLAQLVEHLVYTERVGGSSPSPPTILIRFIFLAFFDAVKEGHYLVFPQISPRLTYFVRRTKVRYRPRASMSALFCMKLPSRRCAGLQQIGLSQE